MAGHNVERNNGGYALNAILPGFENGEVGGHNIESNNEGDALNAALSDFENGEVGVLPVENYPHPYEDNNNEAELPPGFDLHPRYPYSPWMVFVGFHPRLAYFSGIADASRQNAELERVRGRWDALSAEHRQQYRRLCDEIQHRVHMA